MLALIAFSLQAAYASTIHTSYSNDPNVVVPASTAVHWYDHAKPHTNYLIYKGPDPRAQEASPIALNLNGPLVGGFPPGFHPADVRNAYNVSLRGSKAIAVVDYGHLATALTDFNHFSQTFGLPQETSSDPLASSNKVFQVVYQVSGTTPPVDKGWNGEEALDIEWAHALAPDAKIYVIESSDGNLDACNQIAASLLNVKEVSNSWGYPFEGLGTSELGYDHYYVKSGVVFLASAGDFGGVQEYPSTSPNVVGVGGTSLFMNGAGTVVTKETAWSDSGGGPSSYEPRPAFQNGIASKVGTFRGAPDLGGIADPYTGVAVYSTSDLGGGTSNPWYVFGGTSVACPVVAGILNTTNTFFASTTVEENLIYSLLGTSHFRDITQGSAGTFSASVGWDYITGCGSPLDLTQGVVTVTGAPDQASSPTGTPVSTSVSSLAATDGVTYQVRGVPFAGLGSTADVRAHFTINGAIPAKAASATFTITAKAEFPNAINEIFLYNYKTATYDLFATPLLLTTNSTYTVTLSTAQAQQYVDASGNVSVLSRALLPQKAYTRVNQTFLYSVDSIGVSYSFYQN